MTQLFVSSDHVKLSRWSENRRQIYQSVIKLGFLKIANFVVKNTFKHINEFESTDIFALIILLFTQLNMFNQLSCSFMYVLLYVIDLNNNLLIKFCQFWQKLTESIIMHLYHSFRQLLLLSYSQFSVASTNNFNF